MLVVLPLLLLTAPVVSEQHVPLGEIPIPGLMAKRDVCADAFGASAFRHDCAPDFTLCCGRYGKEYPSCEKHMGKGWCCVEGGDDDKCYIDQKSVCDEDSSVECKNLAEGVSAACCPKFTTCEPSINATKEYVRCNINRGDLLNAAKSEEEKTAASEESSSTESASATSSTETTTNSADAQTTESGTLPTSFSSPESSPVLSGGAIGGIVAGAVLGVLAIVGGLYWYYRRRMRMRDEAVNQAQSQSMIAQYQHEQHMKHQGVYTDTQQPIAELADQRRPVELDTQYRT